MLKLTDTTQTTAYITGNRQAAIIK